MWIRIHITGLSTDQNKQPWRASGLVQELEEVFFFNLRSSSRKFHTGLISLVRTVNCATILLTNHGNMKIWVLEENLKSCLVVVSTEKLLKSTNFGIEHYILYTFTIYYIVRLKNFGINVELKVQIVRRVHLTIKGCYIWCLLQYYFEQISEMNETNFIEKKCFPDPEARANCSLCGT